VSLDDPHSDTSHRADPSKTGNDASASGEKLHRGGNNDGTDDEQPSHPRAEIPSQVSVESPISFIWRIITRVLRWLFWAVLVTLIPLFISWLFLPRDEPLRRILEHGELAAFSIALAAGAIDVISGAKVRRGWRNFIEALAFGGILADVLFLAGLAGSAPRLLAWQVQFLGDYCLWFAIAVGVTATGSDVRRGVE
jgi:hypothetical protein